MVEKDRKAEYWLTLDNVDETTLNPEVDPLDTLQRIGKAWLAIDLSCNCGPPPAACDICEIRYLLEEVLVREQFHGGWDK